ncbi:hypothetical protein BDV93DRAFT_168245 [Ceratobasidium sp. AG-I]|nr:hypothetical protein BDV93DRAFT_168245 [Ceratobasidium sp. AG-I]
MFKPLGVRSTSHRNINIMNRNRHIGKDVNETATGQQQFVTEFVSQAVEPIDRTRKRQTETRKVTRLRTADAVRGKEEMQKQSGNQSHLNKTRTRGVRVGNVCQAKRNAETETETETETESENRENRKAQCEEQEKGSRG